MKVYCLHHLPALARKVYMQNLFDIHGFDEVEWIESALPDSEEVKNIGTVYCPNARRNGILNSAEISLCIKHKKVVEDMIKNQCDALIFEDDVAVAKGLINLKQKINDWVEECRELNGDLLFIGSCANLFPDRITPNQEVYFSPKYKTRCTHLYYINLKCAEILLEGFKYIKHSPDWQLNEIIDQYKLKIGWVHPPILQLTDTGDIPSLLI